MVMKDSNELIEEVQANTRAAKNREYEKHKDFIWSLINELPKGEKDAYIEKSKSLDAQGMLRLIPELLMTNLAASKLN